LPIISRLAGEGVTMIVPGRLKACPGRPGGG